MGQPVHLHAASGGSHLIAPWSACSVRLADPAILLSVNATFMELLSYKVLLSLCEGLTCSFIAIARCDLFQAVPSF